MWVVRNGADEDEDGVAPAEFVLFTPDAGRPFDHGEILSRCGGHVRVGEQR